NRMGYYWEESEVHERLKVKIDKASVEVVDIGDQHKIDLRTAAYISALKRINEAVEAKGTFRNYLQKES
ncbi:MAG: glutamate dehydrogenase, partial [Bdellovibrionales bacterium]|nr:glutamate dehydrogenase [Bdellovibrionales bacterium]